MSDISQFEERISAALERIRKGVDGLAAAPAVAAQAPEAGVEAGPDVAALQEKLDEERTANAQLEERVKLLKQRQDGKLSELEAKVEQARNRAAGMDRELQRLRQVNAELRDINDQLRKAMTDGVAEPHLVNKAMLAELEALRATRSADAAEMDAILAELTPILSKEASDAAG